MRGAVGAGGENPPATRLFSQRTEVTVDVAALTCEENSEIKVVQCLIKTLKLEGALVSLDALHTQKNIVDDFSEWE